MTNQTIGARGYNELRRTKKPGFSSAEFAFRIATYSAPVIRLR